jgi:hypothetical protein
VSDEMNWQRRDSGRNAQEQVSVGDDAEGRPNTGGISTEGGEGGEVGESVMGEEGRDPVMGEEGGDSTEGEGTGESISTGTGRGSTTSVAGGGSKLVQVAKSVQTASPNTSLPSSNP